MKTRGLCAIVLILGILAALSIDYSFAEPRGGARRILQELNLSSEQKEQLRDMREQRQYVRTLSQEVMEQRRELRELLKDDSSTEQQILDRVNRLNDNIAELNVARIKNLLEMRRVLTPEQRQEARKLIEQRRSEAGEFGRRRFDRFSGERGERRQLPR